MQADLLLGTSLVFAELKDLVRRKIERYGLTRTINPATSTRRSVPPSPEEPPRSIRDERPWRTVLLPRTIMVASGSGGGRRWAAT